MSSNDCLFCKIADGAIPAKKVFEDELVFAIQDIKPQGPVHLLVIPKKHVRSLAEEKDKALLGHLLYNVARFHAPLESGYGWHLVFVDSLIPSRAPDFAEIESHVKTAWLTEQKAWAWRQAYEAMRAKYTVLLPAPPEIASGATTARPAAPGQPAAPQKGTP